MSTMLDKVFEILTDSPPISDPRMDRIFLGTPVQLITTIAFYLFFIYKLGPNFMKERKTFDLKEILIGYNILQIFFNLGIFIMGVTYLRNQSFFCIPSDKSESPEATLALRTHYYYLLLKYFDLVETVFYVLRKKERQISFLHVYHHIGVLVAAWVSAKYFPGGQAVFVGLYNTLIHCIMYVYYLFSAWNPNYTIDIWWKKYVTLLQIVQHCLIFISILPVVVNVNCTYPKGWAALFMINVGFIVYLFGRFYKNTYLTKKKNK
ncbi:very long chain fatty acid elongase AAEL008004-like [Tenebrio molitor]|uniref:very long chain fatty acid elongase AAEL008004-like n=1 Tax=Tenebrio molitor TaxID=7067 RepID=UPI001C3AFBF6|nr:unnamed protein product [Tenebrio molitor]